MKKLILVFFLSISGVLFSQNTGTIKGTVVDVELDNEPILFADIQLKNSEATAQTNFHGNFEFSDLQEGTYTLVINFLGYQSVEMPVEVTLNSVSKVNVGLKSKLVPLEAIAKPSIAQADNSKK